MCEEMLDCIHLRACQRLQGLERKNGYEVNRWCNDQCYSYQKGTVRSSEQDEVYKEYILSDEWAMLRSMRLYLDRGKCAVCGSTKNLECHHITYDRLTNENVTTDVITLCHNCHNRIHGKELGLIGRPKKTETA